LRKGAHCKKEARSDHLRGLVMGVEDFGELAGFLGVLGEEAEAEGVALCLATGVTSPATGAGAWRHLALE